MYSVECKLSACVSSEKNSSHVCMTSSVQDIMRSCPCTDYDKLIISLLIYVLCCQPTDCGRQEGSVERTDEGLFEKGRYLLLAI